jgi:hypothetical protein
LGSFRQKKPCELDGWNCRQAIEYKFFVKAADGGVQCWQPGNNLMLEVPAEETVMLVTDDWDGEHDDSCTISWVEGGNTDNPSGDNF